jgi:hypothetical protein
VNAEKSACCTSVANSSAKGSTTNSRPHGMTAFSAWRCQGYSTQWISVGAVLPVLPLAGWSPDKSPPTLIALLSIRADQIPSAPLDPPPRLVLV